MLHINSSLQTNNTYVTRKCYPFSAIDQLPGFDSPKLGLKMYPIGTKQQYETLEWLVRRVT